MWEDGVADSQTRSKPLKTLTFRFPKSHKNPGVGGFTHLGKLSQKQKVFVWDLPY